MGIAELSVASIIPESLSPFLRAVGGIVAISNSGGGFVSVPNIRLSDSRTFQQLTPAELCGLLRDLVGPGKVDIRRITSLAGSSEATIFVGPADPFPLVLIDEGIPRPDGQGSFQAGDILIRRAGETARAAYKDTVDLIKSVTRKTYKPESARVLLDVALARRARHPSASLDRMDLLWCLVQRESLALTLEDLEFLLRNSLIRTPTLFFWLAEISDINLVEKILVSSIDDQDRDSSDSKDSILQIGAMLASDACLREILSKMAVSQYAHFNDAAADWQGRRVALNAFDQRVVSLKLDGDPAVDLPLSELYGNAEQIARKAIEANGSTKILGDIGRVVFARRSKRV